MPRGNPCPPDPAPEADALLWRQGEHEWVYCVMPRDKTAAMQTFKGATPEDLVDAIRKAGWDPGTPAFVRDLAQQAPASWKARAFR